MHADSGLTCMYISIADYLRPSSKCLNANRLYKVVDIHIKYDINQRNVSTVPYPLTMCIGITVPSEEQLDPDEPLLNPCNRRDFLITILARRLYSS